MSRRGRRGLSPEEQALWRRVQDSAHPLHPGRRTRVAPKAQRPGAGTVREKLPSPDLDGFTIGGRASQTRMPDDIAAPLSDRLRQAPLRMDAKAHARMTRGKMPIEGRIDLHGLTLAEAEPRLRGFLADAHAAGKRLVLVITGKGRARDDPDPVPARPGALRHSLPQWTARPPLSGIVLQVTPAHRRHGGDGAFYVYLRRPR